MRPNSSAKAKMSKKHIVLVDERLQKQATPLISNIINLYSANRTINKVKKD